MKKILFVLVVIGVLMYVFSIRDIPEKINYGVSFSVFHSNELGLNWREVYDSILNDLGVRRFRLSAHWPMVEPTRGSFNWSELDYQIWQAEIYDAEVILAVGRRLPGWPECHEPEWVRGLSHDEKQQVVLEYVRATVERYMGNRAIKYWQVENEPFLAFFSKETCGDFFDEGFLEKEIDLVRSIDPTREIIVTDSGELSLWYQAYRVSDVFGTSLYLYVWNHHFGPIRYPISPGFFRIKRNIVEAIYGPKKAILSELSTEPWLLKPIIETPIETSLDHMNIDRMNKIIDFAKSTGFDDQYLWGAEWWYYMKRNGHPEFWDRGKSINWN